MLQFINKKNMKKMLTKGNYSDRINFADAGKELKKPWKNKGFWK